MRYFELLDEYNRLKFKLQCNIEEENEIRDLYAPPKKIISNGMGGGDHPATQEKYIEALDDILVKRAELTKEMRGIRDTLVRVMDENIDDHTAKIIMQMVMFRDSKNPKWRIVAERSGYSESQTRKIYADGRFILDAIEIRK